MHHGYESIFKGTEFTMGIGHTLISRIKKRIRIDDGRRRKMSRG